MTTNQSGVDPDAIAVEARVEIAAAQLLESPEAPSDDAATALGAAELGYYEAELTSLRGAALVVVDAERDPR